MGQSSVGPIYSRYLFDRLILIYLGAVLAYTFIGSYFGWAYLLASLFHIVLIFFVFYITGYGGRSRIAITIRWWYPLLLMLPLYYEVELLSYLIHRGEVFDPIIWAWERLLFSTPPHRVLPVILPGRFLNELLHLFYLSYYFIMIGGFLVARAIYKPKLQLAGQGKEGAYQRFVFIMMGTFISYLIIFVLFPVVGPLDDRFLSFHDTGIFSTLIDLLYDIGESEGGAFPSSHIGLSLVVYLLLRPASQRLRIGFLILIFGLTISTVYGAFHYGLDAVAGLVTGPLLYLGWSKIYMRLTKSAPTTSTT
ncbi:phosphatase PAP2 family protein [Candidatus Neomarinimicrobiota bacterium]